MIEELQAENSALKDKLASISSHHNDLRNLTAATEIGTIFLDSDLRIRMFTSPISELFNITDADIGRPLINFTHRLNYQEIERGIRLVLSDIVTVETEVEDADGRCFMMRIRPYRTIEERIDGVVLTFIDISSRHEAEKSLLDSEAKYRALFNSINQGYCVIEMIYDESGRRIPFVAVTGYVKSALDHPAFLGALFVEKPWSETALLKQLAAAIQSRNEDLPPISSKEI